MKRHPPDITGTETVDEKFIITICTKSPLSVIIAFIFCHFSCHLDIFFILIVLLRSSTLIKKENPTHGLCKLTKKEVFLSNNQVSDPIYLKQK